MAGNILPTLRERWPEVFCSPPRPLAIGIITQLHGELYPREHAPNWEFSAHGRALASALAIWCSQREYFEACVTPRAPRYSLNGEACGEVTEHQAAFARASLARLDGLRPPT
ncbi:ProQ/FINO family protein [Bradyrhizobium yuanmingense]|uniref:ProQ/FINO family protein n=1 Tax=Bradyrhizobium yuanmingense TaxID=108015 RepID=UPI0023B99759|nr:ProQ/FINO family protein [Bradyrhizobium yuanmingense]MDF0521589.1 ProQ/FINO family protein [Bradyrhizobium yuanmingense]